MANYSMTCTCGHTMTLEVGSRDEAVEMMRAAMTQEALDEHFRQYHKPDEPKPTLDQAHAMIGQLLAAP